MNWCYYRLYAVAVVIYYLSIYLLNIFMMSDRRLRIIIYTAIPLSYYTKSFPRFLPVFVFVFIVFFSVVVVVVVAVVALSFPRIAVKSLANDDETTAAAASSKQTLPPTTHTRYYL